MERPSNKWAFTCILQHCLVSKKYWIQNDDDTSTKKLSIDWKSASNNKSKLAAQNSHLHTRLPLKFIRHTFTFSSCVTWRSRYDHNCFELIPFGMYQGPITVERFLFSFPGQERNWFSRIWISISFLSKFKIALFFNTCTYI